MLLLAFGAGCAHHHSATAPKSEAKAAETRKEAKKEVKSQYNKPLLSPGAQFAAMPPAVQNAVRAEVGSAEVNNVVKEKHDGQTIYKVFFQAYQIYAPLYISSDGSVLRPDLSVAVRAPESARTGLKLEELPPDVLKIVRDRAGAAELTGISKETWGDRMVYILAFKEETGHPKLYVTSDGAVFYESPK